MISELRLNFSRKRKKHKNPNIARLAFYQQSLVFQKLKIDLIGIRICHVYFGTIHVSPVFFVATPVVLLHGNTSRKVKGLFQNHSTCAMGFSESLSVEFFKVNYKSGSFERAIRSCFAENINFSRLKHQL